jgi:hypothetical protein
LDLIMPCWIHVFKHHFVPHECINDTNFWNAITILKMPKRWEGEDCMGKHGVGSKPPT